MSDGLRTSQVAKWNRDGVPVESADRLAISVGMHQIELWPNWYEIDGAALIRVGDVRGERLEFVLLNA